jgi:endonuclease/exonuclease/phosphatase family metal-dependent hydrolase
MKIISLNTWSGIVYEPFKAFFQQYKDVDVFCLQEIYSNAHGKEEPHPTLDMKLDIYEQIQEWLADTHVGYFRPAHSDYYGQAIFVKKEIVVEEEGSIWIYENREPKKRGGHSRNLHYIRVSLNDKPIVVINLHGLWNGMGKTDTEDRISQSQKIHNFIESRSEEKIVVGDFNLNPDTESLAIVEEGMRNLIKEYGITTTRTSFYDKDSKFADYALVSSGIEVIDFKVLPEEVSDHAALYLEVG